RALTNALLQDCGYGVTRYVSLEQATALTSDEYYAALHSSTQNWHEGQATPWPWLEYFTGLIADAYALFAQRAVPSTSPAGNFPSGTKQRRVVDYLLSEAAAEFSVADIRHALPGISDQTIRLALATLRRQSLVASTGVGRGASWRRLTTPAEHLPREPER
ncbi:MAG: hypothetical protein ACRC0L_08970, partial [Angustibacter sp.]